MTKKNTIFICSILLGIIFTSVFLINKIYNKYFKPYTPLIEKEALALTYDNPYKILKTENSKEIIYNVIDYERNLTYSWSFSKKDIDKPLSESLEMDINLRLNIDAITNNTKIINEKTNQNKLIVSFDYHGELPTKAKVLVNVQNKFYNGEHLYLYYYNPELNQIEFVDEDLIVKNGYVEFEIEHCSDYFLTGAVVNEAVNNPKSINYVIIGLGVIVFILIAITLMQSKK